MRAAAYATTSVRAAMVASKRSVVAMGLRVTVYAAAAIIRMAIHAVTAILVVTICSVVTILEVTVTRTALYAMTVMTTSNAC